MNKAKVELMVCKIAKMENGTIFGDCGEVLCEGADEYLKKNNPSIGGFFAVLTDGDKGKEEHYYFPDWAEPLLLCEESKNESKKKAVKKKTSGAKAEPEDQV